MKRWSRSRSSAFLVVLVICLFTTTGAYQLRLPPSQSPSGPAVQFAESTGTQNGGHEHAESGIGSASHGEMGVLPDGGSPIRDGATHASSGPNYSVTLTETGLPPGTLWSASINTGCLCWQNSTTSTMVLSAPDGYWNWAAWVPSYQYAATPWFGWFTLNGTPLFESVVFVPGSEVSFNEVGLPDGVPWVIGFSNATWWSATTSISMAMPNGSFPFFAGPDFEGPPYYGALPSNGTVLVHGSSVSVLIKFLEAYEANFTEVNLPAGTNWSLTITGNLSQSIVFGSFGGHAPGDTFWSYSIYSTFQVFVSNGTWTYTASAPGYKDISGTFEANGSYLPSVLLNFSKVPPALPIWVVPIGGGMVVGALAALLSHRSRRRRLPVGSN